MKMKESRIRKKQCVRNNAIDGRVYKAPVERSCHGYQRALGGRYTMKVATICLVNG